MPPTHYLSSSLNKHADASTAQKPITAPTGSKKLPPRKAREAPTTNVDS